MARQKNRSKTGCTSCLRRKIKCDEQRPTCRQCVKAEIKCLWDMSSRIHVQRARTRCKATKFSPASARTSLPSGEGRAASHTHDTTFTGHFQLLSCDYNLPEVSSSEENNTALSVTADHDIIRPADVVQNRDIEHYCLDCDSTLKIPSPFISRVYPFSLPCANSILLSHRDRLYLAYFPTSSLVKVLGKAYTWSNFKYICQNKASEEAVVMYAVMALSAREMNKRFPQSNSHDEGQLYYSLALQGIKDAGSSLTCESNNVEAVLSALFLVIIYEWRFGSSTPHLQSHSKRLLMCLNVFFRVAEGQSNASVNLTERPSFTPFCAQILLWILYIDSSCIHGNISFELMEFFNTHGGESQLQSIFRFARHSYLYIHGEQYPAEQHQDDLENYCPLELIHQDYLFRYRIWRVSRRYNRGESVQSELEILWREINIIRKAFRHLFELRKTPSNKFCQRRAFISLCEGLAGYYCNILLIHRLFHYRVVPMERYDEALSELLDLCYTIHEWYPADPTLGFAWYLLIAGLEGKDRIHRHWTYDRLEDLGESWNTCKWAGKMLRLVHHPKPNAGWPDHNDIFLRFIKPVL